MKMFFDVSSLVEDDLTGIGTYTKQLFLNLKNQNDHSIFPICSASRWPKRGKAEKHIHTKVSSSLILPHLPFEFKLLHSPDHRQLTVPAHIHVQTIHDLGVLEESNFSDQKFQKKFRKRFNEVLTNPKIDQFIVVSEFSKSRLLHFYPQLNDRVKVIYSGSNHIHINESRNRIFPWPYLLTTGTLENRKNILGLLQAFKMIAPKYPELRLLLLGKEGYGSQTILKAIDGHPFKDRIIWKNYVSESVLSNAYRFAEMFVFPSFYEGFGFPILEAMRHRCPVVCSSIPSLTEIGGDAILTFNPKDSYQMAEVIEQVFVNPSIRFLLKSRCHANVQKFNWTTTAQQTWDLYMELLRERLHEDVSMENWKIKNLGRLF